PDPALERRAFRRQRQVERAPPAREIFRKLPACLAQDRVVALAPVVAAPDRMPVVPGFDGAPAIPACGQEQGADRAVDGRGMAGHAAFLRAGLPRAPAVPRLASRAAEAASFQSWIVA